jgi:hypothetical protein
VRSVAVAVDNVTGQSNRNGKRLCTDEHPTQHKNLIADAKALSGPSKRYIEALEARLQETEQLLVNILPYISQEQLAHATAIAQETIPPTRIYKGNADGPYQLTSSDLGRTLGPAHWNLYPLNSLEGVQRWMKDWRENATFDVEANAQETRIVDKSLQLTSVPPIQDFQQSPAEIGTALHSVQSTTAASQASDADIGEENDVVMDDDLQYSEEDQINIIVLSKEQNQQASDVPTTSISPEFQDQFLW